jgi:hypothetical protein
VRLTRFGRSRYARRLMAPVDRISRLGLVNSYLVRERGRSDPRRHDDRGLGGEDHRQSRGGRAADRADRADGPVTSRSSTTATARCTAVTSTRPWAASRRPRRCIRAARSRCSPGIARPSSRALGLCVRPSPPGWRPGTARWWRTRSTGWTAPSRAAPSTGSRSPAPASQARPHRSRRWRPGVGRGRASGPRHAHAGMRVRHGVAISGFRTPQRGQPRLRSSAAWRSRTETVASRPSAKAARAVVSAPTA